MNFKRISVLFCCCMAGMLRGETLTLPSEQRPEWLSRDGIVMAGSWEPLTFRVRRDGGKDYTPSAEQLAGYRREHSPEMVEELKALGVNFVMMHCYKGGGLKAEHQSMQDAVAFSKLCHDAGLRVGVYNYSGAFIWETLFLEKPEARDWLLLDQAGKPLPYSTHYWRYFWNRNHPDAQAFYRELVRFAVQEIQTDLIHFDNHEVGPGTDPVSAERFRQYLNQRFTAEQRQAMGITDLQAVRPALKTPTTDPLGRAWLDFSAQSLADAFSGMTRYARTLRKDILMECNPGGPGEVMLPGLDHGRLLQGGEAFWDEGRESGYRDGRLFSRIRTYKIGRRMGNVAFAYTTTPLEAAEAMAFNLDCLGAICWFEFGKIVSKPESKEGVSPSLAPYIRFFRTRRDLLRNAEVVADVAILRSLSSQMFAEPKHRKLTARVEEAFIEQRMPFQIIYDHQLSDLSRYRLLVLAGCVAVSQAQLEQIRQFVRDGGRLCVVGPVAQYDEWMNPRTGSAFETSGGNRVLNLDDKEDVVKAIRGFAGDVISIQVDAAPGVCMELTRQANRHFVHIVNYRTDQPAENVEVHLRVPAEKKVSRVVMAAPEAQNDQPLPFTQNGGELEFRIPRIGVYAVATVE